MKNHCQDCGVETSSQYRLCDDCYQAEMEELESLRNAKEDSRCSECSCTNYQHYHECPVARY